MSVSVLGWKGGEVAPRGGGLARVGGCVGGAGRWFVGGSAGGALAGSPHRPPIGPPPPHPPHLPTSSPRANLFPEVTDLVCRLPLPTFFYRLEAVHLGDLMRFSVRAPVRITRPGSRVSRAVREAPASPSKGGRSLPGVVPSLQRSCFHGATVWGAEAPRGTPS